MRRNGSMEEKKRSKNTPIKIKLREGNINTTIYFISAPSNKTIYRFDGKPAFDYIPTRRIVRFALENAGYDDESIKEIIRDARNNANEARQIIKEAMDEVKRKYVKVKFEYPDYYNPLVKGGYIEKSLLKELLK
jgi:hypothetical protein